MVDAFFYDLSDRQFGALVLFLTLVFAYAQAGFENYRGKALFLRDVPPLKVNVVEDE